MSKKTRKEEEKGGKRMLYQKEKEELKLLIKTGYPLIYIVTPDEKEPLLVQIYDAHH